VKSVRQKQLLAAAASLGISAASACIAHAQVIFNTQDDFANWTTIGATGGTVVTNDSFDSDNSQYNGLGTAAPAGAGQVGVKGSQQATMNAQNNSTNPGSSYYQIGLSNNLITSPDATAAFNGADYIAVDFKMPPADSATTNQYFELKLIMNFDGAFATFAQLDNYGNPTGTFNPMGLALNQGGQINNGTYMTEYFQDEFINSSTTTNLQIGYYFNSDYNETAASILNIDDIRVVSPGWNHSGSGDWNTAANWTTGVDTGLAPNNQGLEADFLGYVTSNTTVTTSATVNIGTILLNDSANSYTLAATGAGNITMNMPGIEPAMINDAAGSHLISAPVNLVSTTCLNVVGAGDTLTISGAIAGAGGLIINGAASNGLTDSGATGTLAAPSIGVDTVINGLGTVKLTSAANTYAGSTVIDGGTLISAVTGALPTGTHVTNNGSLVVNGNATLGSLNGTGTLSISPASGSNKVTLATNSGLATEGGLTIAANSVLDITNNHAIITYAAGTQAATDATIRGYIISGYAGGTFTGTTGITSSTAAATTGFAVGYADGADGVVSGLSSGQLEVKYTLYGDANLDGVVSGDDFTILVGNLGKSVSAWDQGDFNYDGVVSGDDFTLLVGNLGKSATGADITLPAADLAAIDAFASANGLMADVPEPSPTFLGISLAMTGLFLRRRSTSMR
jgi:autotransporter-associated beta strand protein